MNQPLHGLVERFRQLLGPSGVLTGDDVTGRMIHVWRQEPIHAACIVRPSSTAEVATILRWCNETGQTVVPHGGLTGLVQGCNGSEADVVLSLERLNRLRQLDAEAFTMTVEAGMTLAAVQAAARDAGLLFPLSMGSEGSAQIGGALSTNAGGLAVLRYGTARDLVLGLEVVLPDGRIWNGLRGLRKDNTGYDLRHCFVGAEGSLGIITAAVLKLFPAQPRRETAWLGVDDLAAACRALSALRRRLGDCMSSFEYVSAESLALVLAEVPDTQAPAVDGDAYVLVEFSAGEETALREPVEAALQALLEAGIVRDAAVAQSETQRRAFWRLREHIPAAEKALGGSVKHDVSVQIDRLPLLEERARDAVLARTPTARGAAGPPHPGGRAARLWRSRS